MTDAEVVITKEEIVDLYKEKLTYSGEVDESVCCAKLKLFPNEWHCCYKKIKDDVKVILERLENGERIDKETDEELLEKLIFTNHNGVARAGTWGYIKEPDEFQKIISDDKIITSLESLIKKPCGDTGESLLAKIDSVYSGNSRILLVNRIIAASTEKVSSAVEIRKFRRTFKVLINNKIINGYYVIDDYKKPIGTWYNMNLHIMKELRIVIKEGIGKDPDPTYLSMLPWYIWEDKIEKKIKK